MNPGEFRHKTTITVNTLAQQSDYGDFAQSSTSTNERFAKIKWLPGSESIEAEVLNLVKNAEFTYRAESITNLLDRIDTITFGTDIFYIKSVEYKGAANKQYVIIKAHTAVN